MTKAKPDALSDEFRSELEHRTNGEMPRPVHNWGLVLRGLEQLDAYIKETGITPGIELRLAIALQHLVHNPRRNDNLLASSLAAPDILKRRGYAEETERVIELIMLSKPDCLPDSRDITGQLMRDIDRAILGEEPAAYDIYVAALGIERRYLSDQAFAEERGAFLRSLSGHRIYLTDFFRNRYEKAARKNLARELMAL